MVEGLGGQALCLVDDEQLDVRGPPRLGHELARMQRQVDAAVHAAEQLTQIVANLSRRPGHGGSMRQTARARASAS